MWIGWTVEYCWRPSSRVSYTAPGRSHWPSPE